LVFSETKQEKGNSPTSNHISHYQTNPILKKDQSCVTQNDPQTKIKQVRGCISAKASTFTLEGRIKIKK
jgi:hypothetical protein